MATVHGYNLPDDLYYTIDHAWVRQLDNGVLQMGLTDFTQKMASTLTFVKLPGFSDETHLSLPIFSFQSAKWVGWIKPPAEGKVVAVNGKLTENPRLVNDDPYGEGWVVEIQPSEPIEAVLERLLSGKTAVEWLEAEIAKHGG